MTDPNILVNLLRSTYTLLKWFISDRSNRLSKSKSLRIKVTFAAKASKLFNNLSKEIYIAA